MILGRSWSGMQDNYNLRAYVDRLNNDHQQRHQDIQVQLEQIQRQRVQDQMLIQQLQNEIDKATPICRTVSTGLLVRPR